MSVVTPPCPLCRGEAFTLVYPGTIDDPGSDAVAYFGSSRERLGYFDIVRCDGCALVQQRPRDDESTLGRTYAALADRDYDAEDAQRIRTAQAHLDFVNRHGRRGRLLDIGCATGSFVRVAQADGWAVTGLDTSAWSIERARARCPEADFVCSRVEDARFDPGGFDAITLWDTLEHLPDPVQTVRQVREWLVPGGMLFLNVPNADSRVARVLGPRWVLLLREHLWYFDPHTMNVLLEQTGFTRVQTRSNRIRFSVAGVLNRLAQYPLVSRRFTSALPAALTEGVHVRFPIGEMNVAARRGDEP